MSTTTIRIDEQLKDRVGAAAEQQGKTAHAFILETITQRVEQIELEAQAAEVAQARWSRLLADGHSVGWDAAKAYLEARAAGQPARRPAPRKPRG
jgi:predicted DNA-binding protein